MEVETNEKLDCLKLFEKKPCTMFWKRCFVNLNIFNLPFAKLIEKNIAKEQYSNNTLLQKVEH
jgi:hypothetical protein